MTTISTHVLDTSTGQPAAGVAVELALRTSDGLFQVYASARTNADGRVTAWGSAAPGTAPAPVAAGVYRLSFATADYFKAHGATSFFPEVQVVFEIIDTTRHYHIPLLLSPFGYSTYRGS